jgi:hypothetical protein
MHAMHLNLQKAKENGFITDLKPGDKVRIDDSASRKAQIAGGVMRYMLHRQQVGSQSY